MSETSNCGPTAGASGEPDPIFAVSERHRAAQQAWLAAYDRLDAAEPPIADKWLGLFKEAVPDAIFRPFKKYFPTALQHADSSEWIEANTAFLAAIEELAKALEVVLSTPPTTIAGVADLLDYLGRCRYGRELVDELGVNFLENAFEISIEGVRKAAANFLPMIAATLRSLTAESS